MDHAAPPLSTGLGEAVLRVAHWYEQLTPASLRDLERHYAPAARFKDPFNDVQGIPAIAGIFEHMFATLDAPRFRITEQVLQGDQAFLTWEFHFRFRGWDTRNTQCVRGATHLRFNAEGLIVLHRDYWDAAEELYEKLPIVGRLMRWLRGRMRSAEQR